ncbi:MAG TPA: MarR family transcriptional regulator [Candidatus Limnocylindrales bacterium]|nr:MarR family transcriptional regulator [Candidatus Limnocylindrales bacterium]
MKNELIEKTLNINPANLHAYSTGLLQGKAYSRLHVNLTQTLASYNLSIPEWKLLGQLHEHGKIRLAELADRLSYDPPMVTKLAKLLEKKGFLLRLQDPHDERAKLVSITKTGSNLIVEIEPVAKQTLAKILKGVTHEELLTYIKVLTMIVNNTQE